MPRIGSTPEQQSTGGSAFSIPEGNGEIIGCIVVNHAIPGYAVDCGYNITVQPLDKNWKPTNDEPVTEFIKAGPCEDKQGNALFHPGNAASSEEEDPELEIGGAKDCGAEDEAEGTCLLTSGRGPDKKSKLSIFTNSCIEHGVKPSLFNGYAPNLIGLKAHFSRFMMEKIPGSTAKNDPSALIVGSGGQVAGGKIQQYPAAQTGGTTASAPTSSKASAKTAAKPAGGKANGVAAPAAVSADDVDTAATAMLLKVQEAASGQTIERPKLKSRLMVLFAKNRDTVPVTMDKQIHALVGDDEWFLPKAEELGWSVEGTAVTLP